MASYVASEYAAKNSSTVRSRPPVRTFYANRSEKRLYRINFESRIEIALRIPKKHPAKGPVFFGSLEARRDRKYPSPRRQHQRLNRVWVARKRHDRMSVRDCLICDQFKPIRFAKYSFELLTFAVIGLREPVH